MPRSKSIKSANIPKSKRSESRKRANSSENAKRGTDKYLIGKRFLDIRSGKTGMLVDNLNDDYVMLKLDYPNRIVKVKKSGLDPQGKPCQKRCATCKCIPREISKKNIKFNLIPGQPPMPNALPNNSSNNDNSHYNKRRKLEKREATKKQRANLVKKHLEYEKLHSVKQRAYNIKPINHPLYTGSLATCSALMMDIKNNKGKGDMHFLTHIDGGESPEEIDAMVTAIAKQCKSYYPSKNLTDYSGCIDNIQIWAGAGSEKEEGFYLNNPNELSMPVVIAVLTGLDLVDVKLEGEEKIYYKGTKKEIPVMKTCFTHYVGK